MTHKPTQTLPPVFREETERRLSEYRQQGWDNKSMPHGVYQSPFILCPWTNCDYRIAAIDFQLDRMALEKREIDILLNAWWREFGITAKCPKCRQLVVFSVSEKIALNDVAGFEILPDDWHQYAYIVG